MKVKEWTGFTGGRWVKEINVSDFIRANYTRYDGDESFLAPATEATNKLWDELQKLQKEERAKGGVLDMDTSVVSDITSHAPGYLNKDLEKIVGLQTDKPLKRAFMPYGELRWLRMLARLMATRLLPIFITFSTLITRRTTRACSMCTLLKCVTPVRTRSSLVFRTPMVVAASLVTTVVSRFMVSIV